MTVLVTEFSFEVGTFQVNVDKGGENFFIAEQNPLATRLKTKKKQHYFKDRSFHLKRIPHRDITRYYLRQQ